MAAPAQESTKDLSPCKIMVVTDDYEKEMMRDLAQRAVSPLVSSGAGPAIVVSGSSWIIPTSLPIKTGDFIKLLKRLPALQVEADPTITEIEKRMRTALNNFCPPGIVRECSLPLVIVCAPFEKGNECHAVPLVDVWAGPEEIELTSGIYDNFQFYVMDIRKAPCPMSLRAKVPLVTSLGHYSLGGINCSRRIVLDSIVWGHMVSDKDLLTDFQLYATPRMARLCNGTNLPIIGVGKLETEAFDIPCVEFAPGLKMNFASLNQLDRDHGLICLFGAKEFKVRKDDGTVVGAGVLDDGGIYVLKNLQVPKPEM